MGQSVINTEKHILCFGEVLLRMSPAAHWPNDTVLQTYVGGAEANVAFALGAWNVPVKYCSAMPHNFLSEKITAYLQDKKIDTSAIIHSGNRVGLYYMHAGADLKSAGVIYDRAHSSFAELKTFTTNWDEKLENVSHLHLTAISPAVSESAAEVCEELLKAARQKNITVSLDLNYREKLWQYGKQPVVIMPGLAKYCDIIMGNIWSANKMLGIELNEKINDFTKQEEYLQEAGCVSKKIMEAYPQCSLVVNTFRFNLENDAVRYFATISDKEQFVFSKERTCTGIVDKAGSGDCFMAAVLYSLYNQKSLQETVDFASAAATGKLYETGDHTNQTIRAVEQRINAHR